MVPPPRKTLVGRETEGRDDPVEAELVGVLLGDLDELGRDLDLLRGRHRRCLHDAFDQIDVGRRVAHHQGTGVPAKNWAGTFGEGHALVLEEFFGEFGFGFSARTATGRPARRDRSRRRPRRRLPPIRLTKSGGTLKVRVKRSSSTSPAGLMVTAKSSTDQRRRVASQM
jgi:hypothetical protein